MNLESWQVAGMLVTSLGLGAVVPWLLKRSSRNEDRKTKKAETIDSFFKIQYEQALRENKKLSEELNREVSIRIRAENNLSVALTIIDETANTDLVKLLRNEGRNIE